MLALPLGLWTYRAWQFAGLERGWPQLAAADTAVEVREFAWDKIIIRQDTGYGRMPPLWVGNYAKVSFPNTIAATVDTECPSCRNQILIPNLNCRTREYSEGQYRARGGECALHLWETEPGVLNCFFSFSGEPLDSFFAKDSDGPTIAREYAQRRGKNDERIGIACPTLGWTRVRLPGSAHGLRKTRATIEAENGASGAKLDALFGWRTGSKTSAIYIRKADRTRLAFGPVEELTENIDGLTSQKGEAGSAKNG